MKKILVFLVVLALLSTAVIATEGVQNKNMNSVKDIDGDSLDSEDTDQDLDDPEQERETRKKEIREVDKDKYQPTLAKTDDDSVDEKKLKEEKTFKNENAVRDAVHALLAMENRTGGIGQQVSAIAKEFNNGINKTLEAQNKIQNRGWFRRLFMGGDYEAAAILANESLKNSEMVQQLKDLAGKCNCTDDAKGQLKEQINVLDQEQTRLKEMAEKEKKSKGLFGWMKKEE